MNTKLWIAGAVCVPALMAIAQDHSSRFETYDHSLLFQEHEWSLDLFGSVSLGQETIQNISGDRVRDNGRLGAGLGLNYFFTRHLGFGADAYTEDTRRSFVDNTSGSLIVRFPFDSARLAPYIYGGGGRQFDPTERWFGQVGAGLEIRFTHQVGMFVDARFAFMDEAKDVGLGRVGLRLIF